MPYLRSQHPLPLQQNANHLSCKIIRSYELIIGMDQPDTDNEQVSPQVRTYVILLPMQQTPSSINHNLDLFKSLK